MTIIKKISLSYPIPGKQNTAAIMQFLYTEVGEKNVPSNRKHQLLKNTLMLDVIEDNNLLEKQKR